MPRATILCVFSAVALCFGCCLWAADPPGTVVRNLGGTADPAADNGEAVTRGKPGIYCWWNAPAIRPGYVEVIARARTTGPEGVLHFVLADANDPKRQFNAVTTTQRGRVTSAQYEEIYCGTLYWEGSFSPRVSDWSSGGLMVDWVKLVPVPASEVRDPLPGAIKRYEAPRFASAPGVDGDLSEWARVPAVALGPEHVRSADYGGTADLSAEFRFAWTDTHLYFACEVVDDEGNFLPDARNLAGLWKYDSIQMAFDGAGNAHAPGYAVDDYEYGFGLTAAGPRAYRWVAGNNLPVGDVPTIELAVTRVAADSVTRYEAAIPFKELVPFSVESGRCGMTLIVNDNDAGRQQRAWLEWTPGIAGAKDPSAFGQLHLLDAPPSTEATTAVLIGKRDLSDKESADFSLRLRAEPPPGECTLSWAVRPQGAEDAAPVAHDERVVTVDTPQVSLPISLDLSLSGEGRFVLSAEVRKDGEPIAIASTRLFRFAVTKLTERLEAIKRRLAQDMARVGALRAQGLGAMYPRATLGAVEEFARYAGDDLSNRRYERADTILQDLSSLLGQAEGELDRIAADAAADVPVPPMPGERLTVRDGAFYCGDEPQLLLGYCGWWQVWTAVHRLAGHGLNHLQDSIIAPFALFPGCENTPDKSMMEGLKWAWDRGDATKTIYSRMLACNQLPKGFAERYPSAMEGGWSGVCTLDPGLREFQKRYLTTVAQTAKNHPSRGVHVLYGENTHKLTSHPLEVAAFASELKAKYGTIGGLNAAWGSDYQEWAQVGNAQQAASPVAWHDRGRFNQQLFTDWSAWLQQCVTQVDPEALCTGYPSLLSWDDSSDFSAGIDMEALCRTFNVNGFDTAALDYGGGRWAMSSITGFAMPHDLIKAFNPNNPNFDPELHLVNLSQPYPEEYIHAAMFQGCLHGMAAANLWVFQRNEGMDSMLVFQPRVMAQYTRTCLDLRRLTRPVLAFQRGPCEVAIMYSMTSIAYNAAHLAEMRSVYEGSFFLDTKVGFVTERTILEGKLQDKRVLILPAVSHLPAKVARTIADWVAAGGRLVLVGECLLRDEQNRALSIADGLRAEHIASAADPGAYRATLEAVFAGTISRPYRAVDASGRLLDGVEMRTVRANGGGLVYAINMNKSAVVFDIKPRPTGALQDLISRERLSLPLTMEPLDVRVLRAAD